jgi:CubicO group peptidase (beta-lactamase class C family)
MLGRVRNSVRITTLLAGIKIVSGTLCLLLIALLLALWLKPPALLRVGANYSAKIVCSNVFLAGRDPDEVLRADVQAPGIAILRLMRVSVDRERRTVHAGFLGFIGDGLALARPRVGCTTVPDGNLNFAAATDPTAAPPDTSPSSTASASTASSTLAPAAPAADTLWPEGNAVAGNAALQHLLSDHALTGPGMRALLIVDHGRIVAERYALGFSAQTPLLGWSMSKTVVAGLIGMLVKDGKVQLEQSALWPAGDGREHIRIADLLAMSSGLHFNEAYGAVSDVTSMLYLQPDMAAFARNQPLDHPVGESWSYSSGTAVILSRIMQDAAGADSADFVNHRLFSPLGMTSATMEADEHGTLVGSSYMYATARDWARYGQFLLQDGVWQGSALLPAGYVAMMATPVKASGGQYGQGQVWLWGSDAATPGVNPDAAFGIPADTFYMSGHDGQTVAIIRSRQLVIVRLGLTPYANHYSTQPLLKAVLEATQ